MSETKRVGRYEIGSLIGKGAVGSVYRGNDGEKLVAVKVIPKAALAPERLAELREAPFARVRHPAIVPFIEMLENEKAICIVSEMALGESLSAILKSGEKIDLRKAWEISRQVLEALEAAHGKGVFHGDLKPANVFVDRQQRVTVTDFGLANLVANSGTPEFMAPEQLSDNIIDARTDIYQAGALVYTLVTHQPPFSGTREEVTHRVMQERPGDPSTMVPKAAWQLDWVIQRALSKDPADRFHAAREFSDGLRLGLQESIGAPLGVPKGSIAKDAWAGAEKSLGLTQRPAKPAPEATLAQKAKLIAPKAPEADKPAAPAAPKTRVLFVDDEERILNALRMLFRDEYDVVTASSGAAAVELLQKDPVQIVVSDQRMPGMAGVEVLREVKKANPRTVRILLTGYSDLAALVGSINEGEIFRFVKKPWDNDEIRDVLKEAAAAAAKVAPPPAEKLQAKKVAASILVIDTDNSLAKGLQRMLGNDVTVHEGASAADAAKVLQSNDVAAVVADLRAGAKGIVSLFKLLKAKRPDTLSILLSDQPDSEVVADLINQAHVHRFLAKPVNAKELQQHVSEALKRYASGFSNGGAALPDRLVTDPA
jgi:serine/threonine-protein kinase